MHGYIHCIMAIVHSTIIYHTYRDTVLVLEWWSLKPADVVVLSGSDHSERSDGSIVDGVDWFTVPHDLPHRATRVPQEHMAIPDAGKRWDAIT